MCTRVHSAHPKPYTGVVVFVRPTRRSIPYASKPNSALSLATHMLWMLSACTITRFACRAHVGNDRVTIDALRHCCLSVICWFSPIRLLKYANIDIRTLSTSVVMTSEHDGVTSEFSITWSGIYDSAASSCISIYTCCLDWTASRVTMTIVVAKCEFSHGFIYQVK